MMDNKNENDHGDVDIGAWNKMCTTVSDAGFRDGAAAGRDAVFQKGFDMGYAEGYQAASSLGYLKGVISAVLHYNQVDSESAAISLKTALEKTSVGMCQLCQTEPTNLQENKELSTTKPLSDIVANQRDYVNNAIKRIKQDNFQLLQEWSKK